MTDCIFCKFAKGEVPVSFVWENDEFYCINDKYPSAPIHLLVIPKNHVDKMTDTLVTRDSEFWKRYMDAVFMVISSQGLDKKGYQIVNFGAGEQAIDHEHIHIKSGAKQ